MTKRQSVPVQKRKASNDNQENSKFAPITPKPNKKSKTAASPDLDVVGGSLEDAFDKVREKNSTKEDLIILLEKLLRIKLSDRVIVKLTTKGNNTEDNVDIDAAFMAEIQIKGRSETAYGCKQFRHVIPYSFVKEMVRSIVKNAASKSGILDVLCTIVPTFLSEKNIGYFFRPDDLSEEKKLELAPLIQAFSTKFFEGGFAVTPAKLPVDVHQAITPNTRSRAKESFKKQYPIFARAKLKEIVDIVTAKSEEQKNIAIEIISRFIFTLFNLMENAVYASAGNTAIEEIRLYKDQDSAKKAKGGGYNSKEYEVITVGELKNITDKSGVESISGRIRVVDCEGATVKSVVKALDLLNKIFGYVSFITINLNKSIKEYNVNYNQKFKLANVDSDEFNAQYNSDLVNIKNKLMFETKVLNHVAKAIYLAMDFKALEKFVLEDSSTGEIDAYPWANAGEIIGYDIKSGEKVRKHNKSKVKLSDDLYRSEEVDIKVLAQKLVQMLTISTLNLDSFSIQKNSGKAKNILESLTKIAQYDYGIIDQSDKIIELQAAVHKEWELMSKHFAEIKGEVMDVSFLGSSE